MPWMACKLQIFFLSGPFQNIFFFVCQKTVALLIDLIQDIIDSFLRNVWDLLEGLSAGNIVKEFILWRYFSIPFLIWIEKIIAPVKKLVHPQAPVFAFANLVDEEKSN